MTESKPIRLVYLVYGPDAYIKQQAVGQIVRAVLGDGETGEGPTRFPGDGTGLADVLDEVRTYSLLADQRVVIVEDADPFITRHRKSLEKYCAAPSSTGVLVMVCKSSKSNTKLHKAIQTLGGVIACQTPSGRELTAWIVSQARDRYGKKIAGSAVEALRESGADSLGMFDSELAKLASYVGDREQIKADDVHALVGQHREELIFAVTDAMADGDPAAAMKAWERVLASDRSAPMRAVGGLAWSVRRLLNLRHAFEAGANVGSLSRQVRMSPDDVQRRVGQVSSLRFERQLADLLQLDLNSKTGLGDVIRGVEKFIVRHSRQAGSAAPPRQAKRAAVG